MSYSNEIDGQVNSFLNDLLKKAIKCFLCGRPATFRGAYVFLKDKQTNIYRFVGFGLCAIHPHTDEVKNKIGDIMTNLQKEGRI
ncbi:MAG: hypothetical protein AABY22_35025 [Nanoarchaeota archaeon]